MWKCARGKSDMLECMKLTEEGRRELRREFERFERLPFPGGAPNQEARKLRGSLARYDAHAAGLLTRLFEHGQDVDPDLLYVNEDLKSRFEEFGKRYPEAQPFVEKQLAYLEAIHRLIRISKSAAA